MAIRWRLLSWYLVILALLLGLFAVGVYVTLSRLVFEDAVRGAESLGVQVQRLVANTESDQGVGMDLADTALADQLTPEGLSLEIRGPNGRLESRSRNLAGHDLLAAAGALEFAGPRVVSVRPLGRMVIVSVPLMVRGQPVGTALIARSLESFDEALAHLRAVFAASLLAACLVAAAAGYFFTGLILRPIDRITRTARRIGAETLEQRLRLHGPDDELTRLAAAFDEMLDRLEAAFAREQRFVGDAAHELRTPIAIMKADLDVALRQARSADEYRAILEGQRDEVERLTRLAEALLWLARGDAGAAAPEPVTLDAAALEVVDRLAAMAARHGVTLDAAHLEPVEIDARPERLRRAISNVVDNAIKYTAPGGRVSVTVRRLGGEAEVIVRDTGRGILPEHLPHIFERFYRVDAGRSRAAGGAGLGLAIAKELVESEGGRLRAESRVGEGSTFVFTFPGRPLAVPRNV